MVKEFITEYLDNEVVPVLTSCSGETLLNNLVKQWQSYVIFSKSMDRRFDYLNRYFLNNSS